MIFWNQLEGNNITPPLDRTPTYGERLGFKNGAQFDIFGRFGSATPTHIAPGPSTTPRDTSGSEGGSPANPLGKATLSPEDHAPVSGNNMHDQAEESDSRSSEGGHATGGDCGTGIPGAFALFVSALVAGLA